MTTITIQIPERLEHELRARSATQKRDLSAVVLDLVEKSLACGGEASELPEHEWLARFRDWIANRPAYGVVADDSRDSIYEGRGE